MSLRERLARQPPGYNFTIGRILAIYAGLMVTLLLAALDQTIVATALPRIVSDLGGITQYSWVFTAYMLTSTVTVPLYGKLGDVYGRKNLFLFAIVVFLLGSALCGAATTMTQLVLFRAVQGIGAGGLFPLSLAVIGNIVPPRDRGRWQGLIGAVFAASSIIGPAVGGFIVDNASWRWVFLVNLPVGGIALVVISITMPRRAPQTAALDRLARRRRARGRHRRAADGARLGRQGVPVDEQRTSSARSRSPQCCSSSFAFVERRAREPILPFDILRNPIVAGQHRVHGARRHGDVRDDLVRAALRAGRDRHVGDLVGRRADAADARRGDDVAPHRAARLAHRPLPLERDPRAGRARRSGCCCSGGWTCTRRTAQAARNMVIAGIGIGSMMQVFVLSVQNAVPRAHIGSATALTQFSRQMGATIGVTVMGAIVNHGLPPGRRRRRGDRHPPAAARRAASRSRTRSSRRSSSRRASRSVVWVIAVIWVKEQPLRRSLDDIAVVEADAAAPG